MTDRLMRNILADKPRVTKFPIEWDTTAIPTLVSGGMGAGGEASMDGSLAGDMIDMNGGYQSCAGASLAAAHTLPSLRCALMVSLPRLSCLRCQGGRQCRVRIQHGAGGLLFSTRARPSCDIG